MHNLVFLFYRLNLSMSSYSKLFIWKFTHFKLFTYKNNIDYDINNYKCTWLKKKKKQKKLKNSRAFVLKIKQFFNLCFKKWRRERKMDIFLDICFLTSYPKLVKDLAVYRKIQEFLIPCSDRHFYCVNLNKCHYWEQYFI